MGADQASGPFKRKEKSVHDSPLRPGGAARQELRCGHGVHPEEEPAANTGENKSEHPVPEIVDPDGRVEQEIQRRGL